jgi:hypothetical protein
MGLSRRILCLAFTSTILFLYATASRAAGMWDGAASDLARKIASHTGPRAIMTLEVRNQSSLDASEATEIARSLRAELRAQGARILKTTRPQAQVIVTLSENLQGFLWVAEIRRAGPPVQQGLPEVVMIQVVRPAAADLAPPPETLVLRKALVYEQPSPILDLARLESPGTAEARLLVLSPEGVAVYKKQEDNWVAEQSISLTRSRPWPRDPRGRLVLRQGGLFDAYTPGTRCQGATAPALTLECHDSDDAWPLGEVGPAEMSGHFVPDRNFFDGKLTLADQEIQVPEFVSAASVPGDSGTLKIFADLDGRVRAFGKYPEPVATIDGWGSDIAALQSGCGSGWQILSTRAGDLTQVDAIQAYSLRDRAAVEVSAPVELPGPVTALWQSEDGRTVRAVARDLKSGTYEAFTLSISCGD